MLFAKLRTILLKKSVLRFFFNFCGRIRNLNYKTGFIAILVL